MVPPVDPPLKKLLRLAPRVGGCGSVSGGQRVQRLLTWFRRIARVHVMLAVLAFAVLNGPGNARQIGDRLQIALPSIAFACSVLNGSGGEYALRFATMMIVAHGSKHGLGQAPINIRPNGADLGFPSAHTSAAVIGASSIVHDCVTGNPVVKAVVVISAGFVGASRIDSDRHDIWQVLAGALLGWGCDRALRRDSPARRRVAGWFAGVSKRLASGRKTVLRWISTGTSRG